MAEAHESLADTLRMLGIGVAIVAGLFFLNCRYPSLLRFAELKAFDLRLYSRPTRKPHGEVVIVAIDDKSIVELGRWPWPRDVFARLTDALRSYKVAVVGFDTVFSERDKFDVKRKKAAANPTNSVHRMPAGVSNDQTFANAIRAQGNTFIGFPLEVKSAAPGGEVTPGFVTKIVAPAPVAYHIVRIPQGDPEPPVPEAIAYLPNVPVINRVARGTAYFDAPTDSDAVFRSELMVMRLNGLYCEPLIVALTSAYANGADTTLTLADYGVASVTIGPLYLPVDEQGRMLVNFRGPAHTFPYYSISDVIARRVPAQALAGKIALVGASAVGVGDRWSTPMGADFPGVEVHANAIDNILSGDFIQRSDVTAGMERLAAAVMGVGVAASVAVLSAPWAALVATALIVGYYGLAQYLLVAHGLLLGVLFPIVIVFITYAALTSYRHFGCEREMRLLRRAIPEHPAQPHAGHDVS